jgi:hypothetical protein
LFWLLCLLAFHVAMLLHHGWGMQQQHNLLELVAVLLVCMPSFTGA